MAKILSDSGGFLLNDGSARPKIAHITTADGEALLLPIVGIDSLTHRGRFQIDCTLNGLLSILSSGSGLSSCRITFMDRLKPCSNGQVSSALQQYKKLVNSAQQVTVTIYDTDGKSELTKITGIVKDCTAAAAIRQGMDVVLVTYTIVGASE